MPTTLRIKDEIYRQAKAEAAREGITLTHYIEEALLQRLKRKGTPGRLVTLPTVTTAEGFSLNPAQLKALQQASETQADRAKVARRKGKA
jgi:hypothetical protein